MNIQMFNAWYFLFLIISIGTFIGLYFLLRNKKEKTIKIVLFSLLLFALVLHFLKPLFPPYSTDESRMLRDAWFINICAANIALFPFMFFCKNKHVKDYMFYIGVISGIISIIYPMEPIAKSNQAGEWIDIIRFYIHHDILWYVPLLMVLLKIHKLDYKRVLSTPAIFLIVMLFIMINQIFQSELGYIPLRDNNLFEINYKNSSLIWGPDNDEIAKIFAWACPDIFKTIPVGQYAGQTKYWPWFWLICPCFIILTPVCFLVSLIFEHKHLVSDIKTLKLKYNTWKETCDAQTTTHFDNNTDDNNEV